MDVDMASDLTSESMYAPLATQIALAANVPPLLFGRLLAQESGWDPTAQSPAGALGIAQIVPEYHPGVDPMDPIAAMQYAASWLADLWTEYHSWVLVLVHYNGGGGAVAAWQAGTPYDESSSYIAAICGDWRD